MEPIFLYILSSSSDLQFSKPFRFPALKSNQNKSSQEARLLLKRRNYYFIHSGPRLVATGKVQWKRGYEAV